MNSIKSRIAQIVQLNKIALGIFVGLLLVTILGLAIPTGVLSFPSRGGIGRLNVPWNSSAGRDHLQFQGKLSQSKLVQGSEGRVYLEISIEPPAIQRSVGIQQATDMIIVLDRSGSMAAPHKMPYAKTAIHNVLSRLNEKDRFALVAFANQATIYSELTPVTPDSKVRLSSVIASIDSAGGTNMGEGLLRARELLAADPSRRTRKVSLLSDGQANQGITDPNQLASIATALTSNEAVLSNIGLGLGFNETLLASLADYGMGNNTYLEDPAGLGNILDNNLNESRTVFTTRSELELKLHEGVRLVEAGGYPVYRLQNGTSSIKVATGQLLAGIKKQFVMTFEVPTAHVFDDVLGEIALVYPLQGVRHQIFLAKDDLRFAVVEPERRHEAVSSIEGEVYRNSWLKNNLGRMQKEVSRWLREGKQEAAGKAIRDYRTSLQAAADETKLPLESQVLDETLQDMDRQVREAFVGSLAEQSIKRNRAAKSIQLRGRNEQHMSH